MTKIIGLALLGFAVFLTIQNLDSFKGVLRSPAQSLKAQIETDIETSLVQSGIPKSNGIHHVSIRYRSEDAHKAMRETQPSFKTSETGKIWIEVEIIDLPDEAAPGFITQTSVFDKKTNNKIAEFGQTYTFKKYGMSKELSNRN